LWNRQKRIYDSILGATVLVYLAFFVGLGALLHPHATAETLLIRAFGTAAFLLLHIVLAIGPLCRLDRRFLPLLYNRRHLGVTMFFLALAHGVFSLVQFHALGDLNPLVSLLKSNTQFGSVAGFPFQQAGLAALVILFLMAATSHDFWLHTLSPPIWKRLHMLVYAAYSLLIVHVALGALQSERSLVYPILLGAGMATLIALHLAAALKESRFDSRGGMTRVCTVDEIPENRAVIIRIGAERVAVFKYDGNISAISNVCRHQNGPLGEGRIIDGCVTCPWHGYQYLPNNGCSPPPFNDKVPTYRTRIEQGVVYVDPEALPEGTSVPPSRIAPAEVKFR
jgi:nitrite reductase/ring-hydroxylating ferredoxin subunit/DMSO/TMAO reductase YedYZ heme-binding membrane subunit